MSEAATTAPNAAAPSPETAVAALSEQPAVETPAEKPAKLTRTDRKAQILRLMHGEQPAAKPAETAPAADTPASDAAESADARADAIEAETGKPAPAQKASETDVDYDLRLSALQRKLADREADLLEAKAVGDKFAALEQKLARAKEDPSAALGALKDLFGRDYGELTSWIVENADSIKQQQKYAELPPDVREKLERADKDLSERQAKEKTAREQEQRMERFTNYSAKLKTHLETHADDYPLCAASGWAADNIAAQIVDTGDKNAVPMLKKLEATLAKNLGDSVKNDKLVGHLLKDPEIKAALAKHFANAAPTAPAAQTKKSPVAASRESDAPARSNGPTTLTNSSTASDTSAPPRPKTRDERKRSLVDAIRRSGINT